MSLVGPDRNDPYGEDGARLGSKFVKETLDTLTLEDCIQLALDKAPKETREEKLVVTKLEEAQLWGRQAQHLRKRKTI